MPDSYTHVSIALQALLCGKQAVASLPCYIAGANGPDPFYFYQFWRRARQPNLATLPSRLHKEATGPFLQKLLELAITPEQQSYAMGYLTHYATDCTLNPYIAAMGDAGLFSGKAARAAFEASLDSALFYKNYRTHTVPIYAATPMLLTDDLGQIAGLLHEAILAVYGLDIPVVDLADAFHENGKMRKKMLCTNKARRLCARLCATARVGRKRALPWAARFQPGRPLPHLPETWKNPYSGEEIHLSFDEVMVLAEQTCAACVVAAMRYWLGEINEEQLAAILGNNNYFTGLPHPPPAEEAPPIEAQATPIEASALPDAEPEAVVVPLTPTP